MKNAFSRVVTVAVCSAPLLWAPVDAGAQSGRGQFGTVRFPTSCQVAVQPQFERAVAILHSFFYPESVKAFEAVIAADPDCAMAYWGLAISQRPNPLVPPWAAEGLKRGLEAIQKGKALARTERERDWLSALEPAYAGYDNVPNDDAERALRAGDGALARKYPDDKEAAIFYALALLEAVDHADKTYGGRSRRARSWSRSSGRSPTIRAWRTTSSTRTTSSRWPRAAWPPPTSTPESHRRPRTPSTCRRTSTRFSAGGTIRSAPTRTR